MRTLVIFLFYNSLVAAFAHDFPIATPVWQGLQLEAQGWTPRPTEAPSIEDLRKRQSLQGLILAPDGICGYISGSSAYPFGLCCSTCTCGFATTPSSWGALYCCNTAACASRIPTTCIDANRFSKSSACDSNCISDAATMKCTQSPYIYCNLAEFETVNVQALFCDTVTVSHTQSMYTTYLGEVGRVFSSFTGFPSSSAAKSTSKTSSGSSSSRTSSSAPSSSPSTFSSPTAQTKSGSSTPTAPSQTGVTTSAATPASQTDSPAPIGAIVGGSVGGVAVLAIIGVLIFFLIRRRKGSKEDNNPPALYSEHGPTAYSPEKITVEQATKPVGHSEPPMQGWQSTQQSPQQPYVAEQTYGASQYANHQPQTTYQQQYASPDSHYSQQQSNVYPQQQGQQYASSDSHYSQQQSNIYPQQQGQQYASSDSHYSQQQSNIYPQQQGQQYYDPAPAEAQYGRRVPVPAPVHNQYSLSSQSPSELSPGSRQSQGRAELHSQSPSLGY